MLELLASKRINIFNHTLDMLLHLRTH